MPLLNYIMQIITHAKNLKSMFSGFLPIPCSPHPAHPSHVTHLAEEPGASQGQAHPCKAVIQGVSVQPRKEGVFLYRKIGQGSWGHP